jgi:hypothetical protein
MTVHDSQHRKWIIISKLYNTATVFPKYRSWSSQLQASIDCRPKTIKHNVRLILYDFLRGLWSLGCSLAGSWNYHGPIGLVSYQRRSLSRVKAVSVPSRQCYFTASRHSTSSPKSLTQLQHQKYLKVLSNTFCLGGTVASLVRNSICLLFEPLRGPTKHSRRIHLPLNTELV